MIETRPSLNRRFKIVAGIIAAFLLSGWLVGKQYVDDVISRNAQSLALRDKVNSEIASLRHSLWQVDNYLNNYMLTQDKAYKDQLIYTLNISNELITRLNKYQHKYKADFGRSVQDLKDDYELLNKDISYLLTKSHDPYWVYPMLPFINRVLLESNTEFETANNLALDEIASMPMDKRTAKLYQTVVEIRSRWRLMILNFRAVIILYAGLNTRNIVEQEKNIFILHEGVDKVLTKLEKYRSSGLLGIDTDTSLDIMKYRSKKWINDFKRLVKLRKTTKWRADIHFVKENIIVKQNHLLLDLKLLEAQISSWSSNNISKLEIAAHDINNIFGLLSGIALILLITSYVMLKRSVLNPINRISNALASENIFFRLRPNKFDSHEVSVLINAFNSMRKQINNRQKALEHQALHDSLTGLPNRALLEDRLKYSISLAVRNQRNVIIMLLDLNRFKEINDTLGHSVGDAVLKISASRLEECVRESDTVARLGGDEFAIITYGDLDDARSLISRISKSLQNDMNVNGQHLYISSSIGVAVYPDHGNDVEMLMRHADIAMYESKRGKNEYVIYSEEIDESSIDNLALLGSLRAEIHKPTDQFALFFQPQVDFKLNKVVGAEALLRWEHPVYGAIAPEQIIRMAEQTGLISELSKWIIDKAFYQCAMWNEAGYDMRVAINLSAWNIQDPELPEILSEALSKHNLAPSYVELEITESTVMNDPVRAREVLTEISEIGFGILIDDFGTGFSSLSYLKLLPVTGLKIDKSFVIEMMKDDNDKIIVQSTIELAHNLGLTVVAEGVEDKKTLDSLSFLRCDYAQGYFISRPINYADLKMWINQRENRA